MKRYKNDQMLIPARLTWGKGSGGPGAGHETRLV